MMDFDELKVGDVFRADFIGELTEIMDAFNRWSILSNAGLYAERQEDRKTAIVTMIPTNAGRAFVMREIMPKATAIWIDLFMEDTMEMPTGGWTPISFFYERFVEWCKERGYPDCSIPSERSLVSMAYHRIGSVAHKNVMHGARLKDNKI